MNLRYWGKILFKLLKLTHSVYNFNNNGSETGKSGIKTTYWGGKACWRWPHGHTNCVKKGTQDMLTHEHVSSQATLVCEYISTQGMLTREHVSAQGTLAREYVSRQGTLAHEHASTQGTFPRKFVSTQGMMAHEYAFSTQDTQFDRLCSIYVIYFSFSTSFSLLLII